MTQHAFIKLVPASTQQIIHTDELKNLLVYYQEIISKTGEQLSWSYGEAAFPYTIENAEDKKAEWFYLKGKDPRRHKYILIGVEQKNAGEDENTLYSLIHISLTDVSSHGDKGKANELCKFLAQKLKGELHLFNGRIMYYYPKK